MTGLILFSVISLQFCWTYGAGLGHYNFQDAAGGRYGGTYRSKDGQAFSFAGSDDIPFDPAPFADFQDPNSFFPEYFRNFENLIQEHVGIVNTVAHPEGFMHQVSGTHYGPGVTHHQSSKSITSSGGLGSGIPTTQYQSQSQTQSGSSHQSQFQSQSQTQYNAPNMVHIVTRPKITHRPQAFAKSFKDQKKALDAARKAFDLTSNQAGFTSDFGFDRFPMFGPQIPQYPFQYPMGQFPLRSPLMPFSNGAFAGAAIGPGYQQQMINLYPPNSQKPNIQVSQFSDPSKTPGRQGGFYSVQSSSFASSSNINGQPINHKGGQTVVNDNGKITKYTLGD